MNDTTKSLRKAINRIIHIQLAWRMSAVALLAALIGSTIVILRERDRFREQTVSRAIQDTRALESLAAEYLGWHASLDWQDLQRLLDRFIGRQKIGGDEELVRMEILDRDQRSRARYSTETPEQSTFLTDARLKAALKKQSGATRHGNLGLDGQRFIVVQTPIPYHTREIIAHSRAIFRVPPETLGALWRRVQFTIALLLGIIAGVVFLLYPLIARLVRRLAHSSADLLDSNLGILETLGSAIAKRDSDTDAHNYRATLYSIRLGEALGLEPPAMRSLIKGALLHDVGKIGIRDEVLLKPGRLSEEEYREMKRHVSHGLEIVARAPWLADSAAVVGYHHEKYDGSGYERGLAAQAIPINARIFAVADVFDALTSERPYKSSLGLDEAQSIMREGRGAHFAPEVLDTFFEQSAAVYEEYARAPMHKLRLALNDALDRYFRQDVKFILLGDSFNKVR